jgi:hypothetical protein
VVLAQPAVRVHCRPTSTATPWARVAVSTWSNKPAPFIPPVPRCAETISVPGVKACWIKINDPTNQDCWSQWNAILKANSIFE